MSMEVDGVNTGEVVQSALTLVNAIGEDVIRKLFDLLQLTANSNSIYAKWSKEGEREQSIHSLLAASRQWSKQLEHIDAVYVELYQLIKDNYEQVRQLVRSSELKTSRRRWNGYLSDESVKEIAGPATFFSFCRTALEIADTRAEIERLQQREQSLLEKLQPDTKHVDRALSKILEAFARVSERASHDRERQLPKRIAMQKQLEKALACSSDGQEIGQWMQAALENEPLYHDLIAIANNHDKIPMVLRRCAWFRLYYSNRRGYSYIHRESLTTDSIRILKLLNTEFGDYTINVKAIELRRLCCYRIYYGYNCSDQNHLSFVTVDYRNRLTISQRLMAAIRFMELLSALYEKHRLVLFSLECKGMLHFNMYTNVAYFEIFDLLTYDETAAASQSLDDSSNRKRKRSESSSLGASIRLAIEFFMNDLGLESYYRTLYETDELPSFETIIELSKQYFEAASSSVTE